VVPETKPQERDEIIDVSRLVPGFRAEIVAEPGGERFMRCFSCGTCVSGCPVAGMTPTFREVGYNPRRIVRMALLGMRQEVLISEFVWRGQGREIWALSGLHGTGAGHEL
jgi:heterodisulfide reductase subunit C